ncbi:MAG: type II toxin-antitoxin system VapC family toxin [Gammaproteobacteria bacterium]|uniref:type II toxin-antitoxin system tRNA(fMet)-specific endonuclease VapC n=1 Tax=Rhodoferax sp. TaxID=50421 RepID=UPI0018236B4A|nr:type II toxin-antitoxin system VapC family toxin [Rhodoferax sp.]MBU3899804.1 type II toxin-antitoxin system VapC family toxin [Gammaproteobacteria bacterium]MBA3059853.1 type II toxin-antitoxin system VapC family toxin [Rhodoferax sp.]MBU3998835.1 type II toxin-antitoxin system VapC family toxin [Gammaproteobacteria bacterium]MBU4019068.1 type II toxin-antitoxin system VapC family toxin [Gammaproteobacteria bacterium]MBU4078787.1 type II toxin-antitoxin system VapC family toxin [Gammaprote
MMYLLDTNICIYVINEQPAQVLQRLIQVGRESLAISTVTVAELAFGVEKSDRAGTRTKLENFLSKFPILDWNQEAAWVYGRVRKVLEAKGQRIGERDLLLACQALALGATMVTNNTREFERIDGLKLENWVA